MRMSRALSSLIVVSSTRFIRAFQPLHISSTQNSKVTSSLLNPDQNYLKIVQRLKSTQQRRIRKTLNASIIEEIIDESKDSNTQPALKVNLLTIHEAELETLLASWKQPKYRAKQILSWVHEKGITDVNEMNNIPKKLRSLLEEYTTIGTLELDVEVVSKDGTRKRAYRLKDNQLIESVLMPYEDGRQTACISSQAGCAMGCVFCATGQMGFARQLTPDEIFEQVAKFSAELKKENKRLSNVVMMGMGEPLANYRNVMEAIKRMNTDLGIGARKITVSTVGVVPNIRKLMEEDLQVRLAVSLHCSSDEERSQLLPANKRYGGLDELMNTIREYIDTTNRRVTLEWALIENENDTPEVARQLGQLLKRFGIRRDMTHINLIPLNPTGGYEGSPSGRKNVNEFVNVLDKEFGIKATPRVRRGIDIDAGCGQLKAAVKKKEEKELKEKEILEARSAVEELQKFVEPSSPQMVGVWEDEDEPEDLEQEADLKALYNDRIRKTNTLKHGDIVNFELHDTVNLDNDEEDFDDESYENDLDKDEAARLINLVKLSFPEPKVVDQTSEDEFKPVVGPTTTIIDEDSIRKAKKRRKKLLKNLKAINKLKDMQANGKALNEEQMEKVEKEKEWKDELESVEHNLQ